MTTLNFLIAACLDPVQAALVLAIVLAYRGPQTVMVSGVATALVSETVMVLAASDYTWGELLGPRIVSGLVQAAVLLCCVRLAAWLGRRIAARFSTPVDLEDAAGLEPVGSGIGAPHVGPWHMRGYARRRYRQLLTRKIHP